MTVAEGGRRVYKLHDAETLQWGRNLTVAEGHLAAGGRLGRPMASMGPQLDSCGRMMPSRYDEVQDGLQWGRNLTVAEGPLSLFIPARMDHGFNGAAT